ncbi:MAG: K(+)-transporting ATPase subunit C [Bacteroidetes bacterium]|nr:K(+)-transporting ATPase subunit C [Bacteroidota bacterium]
MIFNILKSVRLSIAMLLFFSGVYPLVIWGFAQLATEGGKGEKLRQDGNSWYAHVGQKFTRDDYFYSRPSAVDYNAAGSGGSNKSPDNPEYLALVQARIDRFLVHNPGVQKSELPSDLVCASGSGLDPDISVEAARVQVKRISKLRKLNESTLLQLIEQQTEKPFLGLFGPSKIPVLKINLALDQVCKSIQE